MVNKIKSDYDENGHWVQERTRIKGAIRKAFRMSPQMKATLQKARVELNPLPLANGQQGKKIRVRYRCAHCKELFSRKNVQVDHILTVVPLWKKEKDMSYDELVKGVFCKLDNLQVLCSTPMKRNDGLASCHKKKTDEEKWIRKNLVSFNLKEEEGKVLSDEFWKGCKGKYKEELEAKKLKKQKRKKNE